MFTGYVSFVYNQPGEGSLMIKHLTKVFREFAATEDIDRLLIRVRECSFCGKLKETHN